MTPLQAATHAVVGELLAARERLDAAAYQWLVNIMLAWVVRELERLTLDEAARAKRGGA